MKKVQGQIWIGDEQYGQEAELDLNDPRGIKNFIYGMQMTLLTALGADDELLSEWTTQK